MSQLRESVIVRTLTGDLDGELFVGTDGLPELEVLGGGYHEKGFYRPATLPADWTICYHDSNCTDELIYAWTRICDLRQDIIKAQREAEDEERNG